ncbi:MAG TPA: type 2 isopentenyl-diphosphate Delta-isomerase [Thermoplasmatales archaeon]|nr:type 2 isopentenyl-diphosphate Delta-isomerase [Thermoplasmatales archaeon]
MNQIENRKDEHVRISLEENVSSDYNYWDDVALPHNALPEVNLDEVNLSTRFLEKHLEAPIIIAGMTGGYSKAKDINSNLAAAAERFQIGMGVGSQRAALETPELKDTYSVVKDYDIPLRIANIGASQLVLWGHEKTMEYAQVMIDMIDAHAFAVCLNFLQEVTQFEGEAHAKGCLEEIKLLAEDLDIPVIVKESGAGISADVAKRLMKTKIAAIDVGGLSGTSFAAIEHYRAEIHSNKLYARLGRTFWNWGIPTPLSVINVGEATDWRIPIIATGGIRNGLDASKALALGADMVGIARTLLKPAVESKDAVVFEMESIIRELRAAMFLMGVDEVSKLKEVEVEVWI